MMRGSFVNQKLAKKTGYAQQQARLALEAQKRQKPGIPSEKQRAIINFAARSGKGRRETEEDHARS